jgi:hypothetical protein
LYATNEELRKQLPGPARELPVAVRRRFEAARAAGREASARRRAEILRELESHGGGHNGGGHNAGGHNAGRKRLEAPEDITMEIQELPPVPEEPAVRAPRDF